MLMCLTRVGLMLDKLGKPIFLANFDRIPDFTESGSCPSSGCLKVREPRMHHVCAGDEPARQACRTGREEGTAWEVSLDSHGPPSVNADTRIYTTILQ